MDEKPRFFPFGPPTVGQAGSHSHHGARVEWRSHEVSPNRGSAQLRKELGMEMSTYVSTMFLIFLVVIQLFLNDFQFRIVERLPNFCFEKI